MANETVTTKILVLDTVSADMITAAGSVVEVDSGNTAVITNVSPVDNLFIWLYENGGGEATATVAVGDRPPAERADAALVLTIPSSDGVVVVLEASKYIQDDDTIDIAITGQNVFVGAFRIPRGA